MLVPGGLPDGKLLVQHPEKLRVQQRHLLEVRAASLALGFYVFTGSNVGVEVFPVVFSLAR